MYDLIVIGAGPGGTEAALFAAECGMKTAIIERDLIGGTCLNRGCIPTKTLLHTSTLMRELKEHPRAGLRLSPDAVSLDAEALWAYKDEVTKTLREGLTARLKKAKVDIIEGSAMITSPGKIMVKTPASPGDLTLEAANILIATGSAPSIPPIPGISTDDERILTSDSFLARPDIPKRLVIIGGGVIGTELASVANDLGAQVTVIEAMDRLLPTMDREFGTSLKLLFKKRGITAHIGASVTKITDGADGGKTVCFSVKGKEEEAEADAVLIATGRKGVTDSLFAEGLGIETDRGQILTDENGKTGIDKIYAIGDVAGKIQLAHAASAAGVNAVCAMLGRPPLKRTDIIPACVYTEPEIASVGITADEAKAKGMAVRNLKYPMGANGKSVLTAQERGFIRVLAEEESGRILGAQLMCANATDMISQLAAAIVNGLTVEDLAHTVFPHPTFGEAIGEALLTGGM